MAMSWSMRSRKGCLTLRSPAFVQALGGALPSRTTARTLSGNRLVGGELVEAATRLMATDGREDQVPVRAVARRAGVAPQSFYLHFATIDELLWDVYASE
jgi:hypothetical protein